VPRVNGPPRGVATWWQGLAVAGVLVAAVSCSDDEPSPPSRSTPSSSPPSSASTSASESAIAPASLDEVVDEVQAQVDSQAERDALVGAIVLVRIDDHERVVAGGLSLLEPSTVMGRNDTFTIASITKSMVAATVLRLAEQGRMSLDDTVEEWLPGLVAGGEKITIAHLLSHQSGLPETADDDSFDSFEQLVRVVGRRPRLFEPGEKSYYSNVNYYLVGLILEKVTGQPLATVLDEQVFAPARMTSTRLDSPPSDEGAGVVHGYEDGEDVTGIAGDFYAAGAVVSTARDLSRFFRQLLGGDLLPPDVVADMATSRGWLTNRGGDYGLGISLPDGPCGPMIGHSGSLPGFSIDAYTLEDRSRFAVVMVNTSQPAGAQSGPLLEAALCG
jgi:D-alanyl-D-alanine carboxypeptidase